MELKIGKVKNRQYSDGLFANTPEDLYKINEQITNPEYQAVIISPKKMLYFKDFVLKDGSVLFSDDEGFFDEGMTIYIVDCENPLFNVKEITGIPEEAKMIVIAKKDRLINLGMLSRTNKGNLTEEEYNFLTK